MTQETPSRTNFSHQKGAIYTRLGLLAATLALAGSLWAAFQGPTCGDCRQAITLLSWIPLAWSGIAYFTLLAVAIVWKGLFLGTRIGFFTALGVHIVLVSLLVRQHLFCGPCVFTGSAALAGALVGVLSQPRTLRWAAMPIAIAALITIAAVTMTRATPPPQAISAAAQELPDGSIAQPVTPGHVRLVLFERDGCKHCVQFDEDILPPLQKALGDSLEIERREPTLDMETPTIVVVGKGSRTFTGLPEYKDLEDAAQSLR